MSRRLARITLVVPDASPLLSLGRVGRLDIFSAFTVPIHIVDVVAEEAVRPQNDINGAVRAWLDKRPNNVSIIETNVGLGLKHRRERGETPPTGNLGEIAVDEYATVLARHGSDKLIPLVLFEDPDMLELRVARLSHVHLVNTAALLRNLKALDIVDDATDILDAINRLRASPMEPIERPAKSAKIRSTRRNAVK